MVKDIKAVIEAILDDEDMPEHMVTKTDDEQMRALLEKHLLPSGKTDDRPETYFSWCDDGVTIMCERQKCWLDATPPLKGKVFYQEVIPHYWLTIEVLQQVMDEHVATHEESDDHTAD